jgi:hypothetical protein
MLSGLGVISPRPPRAAMAISAALRLKPMSTRACTVADGGGESGRRTPTAAAAAAALMEAAAALTEAAAALTEAAAAARIRLRREERRSRGVTEVEVEGMDSAAAS